MAFRSRQKTSDGKYLRLTGLWQSKKKDNLWSGKMRTDELEKLVEKAEEAREAGCDLVFFLWDNEKENRKSPDFTLQVTVAEEEVASGRSRSSHSRSNRHRDHDEDRDTERDNERDANKDDEDNTDDEDVEENDKEDRKSTSSRKSHGNKADSKQKEGRSKKTAKDDNW